MAMIGVWAEIERSSSQNAPAPGVKDALRRGVKFGSKPKLTQQPNRPCA
jgi:hypothetical protein